MQQIASIALLRGGDTDINAAICGALPGAGYGREAIWDQRAEWC